MSHPKVSACLLLARSDSSGARDRGWCPLQREDRYFDHQRYREAVIEYRTCFRSRQPTRARFASSASLTTISAR